MTQLDFTAPHTVFVRIPDAVVVVASVAGAEVLSDVGLRFAGTVPLDEVAQCDMLFVPGGFGANRAAVDEVLIGHVRRLAATATYVTSVCTGSLVVGAAASVAAARGLRGNSVSRDAPPRGQSRPSARLGRRVRKRRRRLNGVDEIILSLYAKGLTTGEISAHFAEIYGASVGTETISRITDKVIEEMNDWADRPFEPVYAAVFVDAIVPRRPSPTARFPPSSSVPRSDCRRSAAFPMRARDQD